MDDFTIKGVVDPIGAQAVDPRKTVLDGILEKFKTNAGKWVEIGVAGDTPEAKKKKVRGLSLLISKLSKIEPVYSAITLRLSQVNGQLNLYAKQRPARKPARAKKKNKAQNEQQQSA